MICIVTPCWALGTPDWQTEAMARSFPMAAYYKGVYGHSFENWNKKEKAPFLYGFIRPSASLRTSAIINALEGKFEFYPISIFGIFVGKEYVFRQAKNLDTFDCNQVECKGTVNKDFFGARLALKFGPVFLLNEFRYYDLEINRQNRYFTDELSTLLATPNKDKLESLISIIGYEINANHALALLRMSNDMKQSHQNSSMNLLLWQWKRTDWSLLLGPGIFHTRDDQDIFTTFALWNWKPAKGLLLF